MQLNNHSSPPDRFATEPVIGWRVWLADESGALYSPKDTPDRLWQPGAPFEALCWAHNQQLHDAPNLECGWCGVHAWRDGLHAGLSYKLVERGPHTLVEVNRHPVYGQVALWGRVIEHQFGYRGQFAYPHSLRVWEPELAQRIYQTYGIETEAMKS